MIKNGLGGNGHGLKKKNPMFHFKKVNHEKDFNCDKRNQNLS